MAGVDLHQLAKARPPVAQLKHPLGLARLGPPQAQTHLDLTYALRRDHDPLGLRQFLAGQGRAKIGIARAWRRLDPRHHVPRQPVVRRPPAPDADDAPVAARPVRRQQPLHLPNPDPQKLRRAPLPQLPSRRTPQDIKPLTLRPLIAKISPPKSPSIRKAKKGTSQLCRKGTFQLGANTSIPRFDTLRASVYLTAAIGPGSAIARDRGFSFGFAKR